MKKENLMGQKFGTLTVLEKSKNKSKDNRTLWICQCDCGNIIEVLAKELKSGKRKNCGCLTKNDLTGKRFGTLTVLEKSENKSKDGQFLWICQCDCGNIIETTSSRLKMGIKCNICNITKVKYCKMYGLNLQAIDDKARRLNITFMEASKVPSKVIINRIRTYKGVSKNLLDLCNYFNKNFKDVYESLKTNHTLEWSMEHASDTDNSKNSA